jgi:hypothetical protein
MPCAYRWAPCSGEATTGPSLPSKAGERKQALSRSAIGTIKALRCWRVSQKAIRLCCIPATVSGMELLFRSETADSSQHAYVGPPSLFEQSCDECSSSPRVNPARAMTAHDIRTTVIQMKKDHGLKPMTDRMLLGRTSLTVSQNAKCATRRSVRRLLLRPRPACGERAAHEFQQTRLGEGEGQAPHPFFVVELPNSPLPASGERAQQQPPDVCDTVRLERDEFRFALPLNQSPFVPAEAGTQGPRTRPKNWVPASAGTNGI